MRWTWGSAVLALVLVTVSSGCGLKSVTREDRIANSVNLAKAPPGTQVTDRQVAMADQDKTLICESQKVVGSNIPVRRCRTARQIEEERLAAKRRSAGGCGGGVDLTGGANAQRVDCLGK